VCLISSHAAGILSLATLTGSLNSCQPMKRSSAISIYHSVTSLNKAGGVTQAVLVTDGSTSSTVTTTTLDWLIDLWRRFTTHGHFGGDTMVLTEYALMTTTTIDLDLDRTYWPLSFVLVYILFLVMCANLS